MSREKPKNIYKAKVTKFGDGAKLKAYKKHINEEVIIMKKGIYKQFLDKIKKVSDKKWTNKDSEELDKLDDEIADKWSIE